MHIFPDREANEYVSEDGWMMKREYCITPNGNSINGEWVLRDDKGNLIDHDLYRNDLMERNDCEYH